MTTIATRILLALLLAGAGALAYDRWAEHQREIGREEMRGQFAREARDTEAKREVVTQYVDREVVKLVQQVSVVTETIVKEVPVYVPVDTPPLPAGWRVLHDAAARGQVPSPSAIPDAAPVAAQDAAATVAANYGACRADQARLRGLQEWITRQQQLK